MSVRKFWLTNGTLQNGVLIQYELTKPSSKAFLNNPVGLGFAQTLETTQYDNTMKSVEGQNFPQIQGEVVFVDSKNSDRYDKYNKFVEFLTHSPLVLHYQIPKAAAEEYMMNVAVVSLEKTETKPNGILSCSITLQCLSRWKGLEVAVAGTSATYTLTNNGHMPCGFVIEIDGTAMVNPYFTLEQNSELYGEAKFTDATGFSSVSVNSNDGEQNIILEQGGSVLPNPLLYQDLSISNGAIYVTFIKLARGTSTLTIGMDSGSLTGVLIKYTPLYRSV